MKKVYQAHIESNGKGWYSIYTNEEFPFGFFGEGNSIESAKKDFLAVFEASAIKHKERTGIDINAEFEFVCDMSAILQECKNYISFAFLSKITGINKAMLSQYACGTRKPKAENREKIIKGIHQIGNTCLSMQ